MLRSAWFIASRDIAHLLKQKDTLVWVFFMPFVFFFFLGKMTGGGGGVGMAPEGPVPLGVRAPVDGGFLVDELLAAVEREGYEVHQASSEAELAEYTRRLILPEPAAGMASLTDSLLAGNPASVKLERDGKTAGARLDQVRLGRAVYGLLADLVVLEVDGTELSAENLAALRDSPRALTLAVEPAGKRQEIPAGMTQTIPGTMVMFTLLVLLTSGAIQLVVERKGGLLRRLASAPISRSSILFGKWIGRMAFGLVQIAVAMLGGTLLFDMDWGADLPMVMVVLFFWAAFCTSAALLMANLVRTEQQMGGLGVVASLALAALGGCWWPIEITPDWMQTLAGLLPTGWIMDAMHQLIAFENGPASALPAVGLLAATTVVLSAVAVRRFRYQ